MDGLEEKGPHEVAAILLDAADARQELVQALANGDLAKRLLRSVVAMLPPVDGSAEFLDPPNHG
jgi:hypothetical protein